MNRIQLHQSFVLVTPLRFCILVTLLSVLPLSFLRAQHHADGQPLTEDQLVNDADPRGANRETLHPRAEDGTTSAVSRDAMGRAGQVEVKDRKDRLRRRITIHRNQDGTVTTENVEYRADGKPDSSTTTTWSGVGTGRSVPTGRNREIYDVNVRLDQNGKPVPKDSWYEELRDGRWIRVPRPGPSLQLQRSHGEPKTDISGTGQTIGHVADLRLTNMSKSPMKLTIPPMILESVSGKTQHYAVPGGQEVAMAPGETKTVPVEGVCLVRNKPPVAAGVTGDLVINDGGSESAPGSSLKVPSASAQTILRIAQATYKAAQELEKEGALKAIPYSDPKKKKDIVVQWSTWMNPEIAKLTGVPPATKQDLAKVVYRQVEEGGPVTPEKKKKIDEGINTIFEKIELTSAKAKDLEKAALSEEVSEAAENSADATKASPDKGEEKP